VRARARTALSTERDKAGCEKRLPSQQSSEYSPNSNEANDASFLDFEPVALDERSPGKEGATPKSVPRSCATLVLCSISVETDALSTW